MQTPQLRDQKHKKILLYFQYLSGYKINLDECLKYMRYVFSLSESRMTYIIKNHNIEEYDHIELEHFDLDLIMINSFAKKVVMEAQKQQRINSLKPINKPVNNSTYQHPTLFS